MLTPAGEGGISVIQVQGQPVPLLEPLFRSCSGQALASLPLGQLSLGTLSDREDIIDEVLVAWVDGKRDCLEIQCHGGTFSVERILNALERSGAHSLSPAEWLECKVARGQMDLIQTEAAERIPHAASTLALELLLNQYRGALSSFLKRFLVSESPASRRELERLIRQPVLGDVVCRPRRVVLAGPPNAGKSSLFNALVREERVLTADIPGTTRDAIHEGIVIEGVPFVLVDTAGLQPTDHPVELLSIEVSRQELIQADLVFFVLDGTRPIASDTLNDFLLISQMVFSVVLLANKIDSVDSYQRPRVPDKFHPTMLEVSAVTGAGLPELESLLADTFAAGRKQRPAGPAPFTARQIDLLEKLVQSESLPEKNELVGRLLGKTKAQN